MIKKEKQPWPTKDAMNQIYEQKLWGGKEFDFYSGSGSHIPEITNPYLEAVITFLNSFKTPLIVCDLGCGDFNIGQHLTKYAKKYFAVDIVEAIIIRNKKIFTQDNLKFKRLDIAKNELPLGDCAILRQVLQHLSNKEIQNILKKLELYKYIILTEHLPLGKFEANKDIISGQGIRLKKESGVCLTEEPFNLKFIEQTILNEYILTNNMGRITTTLYKLFEN